MNGFQKASRPLVRALFSTILSVLVVAALRGAGIGAASAIQAGLAVAGALTIFGLASLKGDNHLPTCQMAIGEPGT